MIRIEKSKLNKITIKRPQNNFDLLKRRPNYKGKIKSFFHT